MATKKNSVSISETNIPNIGIVKAGKVLEHPMLGIGEVIDIAKWDSGEITININFKKHGSKWLVPEHANLSEPIKKGFLSKLFGNNT